MLDAASGIRAPALRWQKIGDAERATHCAEHAVRSDDLVDDPPRGPSNLLGWLALEATGRGAWELAARYEERAAQAEHDAAMALNGVKDTRDFGIHVDTELLVVPRIVDKGHHHGTCLDPTPRR